MTTETETANVQPDVSSEDTKVLARVLFKAQNVKNKGAAGNAAENAAENTEELAFKDAKKELMPVARRMLKILARQGYTLSKSDD